MPSTKGTLTRDARSRSSTTGWATAARREGARARRRARRSSPPTTTTLRAADGLVVPGRRRVPGGDAQPARARPRRARRASAPQAGTPLLGICLGMQLLFERSTEHGGDRRARAAARRGRARSTPGGLKLPHIGWNVVTFDARLAADRRPAGAARPSTTCTRSSRGPPTTSDVVGPRRVRRRRSSRSSRAATSTASSSTPRSPRPHGLALLRNFAAAVRAGGRLRDPLPGDRHPRRPGRAPRPGRLRREDRLPRRRRSRPRARGSTRARASCTSSTSTARAPARRRSLDHLGGSPTSSGVPVQYGGGLRSLPAVRDALRAGAERVILGTAAFTRRRLPRRRPRRVPRARDRRRVDTRGGNIVDRRAGQQTTQMPAEDVDRAPAAPRRALVRLHERRPRRDARGPRPRRGPPDRGRRARALPVLGRDRLARRPARRLPRCARSTSAA